MGEMILINAPHKRAAMLMHPHAYRILSHKGQWAVFYTEKSYYDYTKAFFQTPEKTLIKTTNTFRWHD